MITGFINFIINLMLAAGNAWQYDIPAFWEVNTASNGMNMYSVVYFSDTGELDESTLIEAPLPEIAEKIFAKDNNYEVFEVLKVTK